MIFLKSAVLADSYERNFASSRTRKSRHAF